jgi:hypothetical protein
MYEFLKKARAFVPGKPFQPSLALFEGKVGAYPKVEYLKGVSLM